MIKQEPEEKIPDGTESSKPFVDSGSLESLFGPGSGNLLQTDKDDYDIPEDVQGLFDEHGLAKRNYRVLLKQMSSPSDGDTNANGAYITSWTKSVPTIDWIAKNYGPGEYVLVFSWRARAEDSGKLKGFVEQLNLSISEKYRDDYEDYQFEKRMMKAREKKSAIMKARLNNQLEIDLGIEEKPRKEEPKDLKQYVREISEMASLIGLQKPSEGTGIKEIIALMMPFLPSLITFMSESRRSERERQDKLMSMMLGMSSANSNHLVEMMKHQQGPTNASDMLKEFKEMLFGAIDLKSMMKETTESSPVDRIFEMIEKVSPMIMTMMAMSQQKREASIPFQAAKSYVANNEEFQQVAQDPKLLRELIVKLDAHYGVQQTDQILMVAGLERPQDMIPVEVTNASFTEEKGDNDEPQ